MSDAHRYRMNALSAVRHRNGTNPAAYPISSGAESPSDCCIASAGSSFRLMEMHQTDC